MVIDFWTLFPYWAILVLVVLNALLVQRMNISIREDDEE